MDVLKKKKEKEGEPTEVQLLLDEMRKGRNLHQSNNNNNFFKRAELKHGNFKPGETNFKEWFEVFEMSAQNLPESAKLLLLQQSLEGAAKECIRNITPGNGGYKLAITNMKATYGDAIKNASEEMSQLMEWAIQPAGKDLGKWREDYNKMAGLIFNLVRFEVDGECAGICCDGHNKESLAINRLLVAIMTKKLPGFLALQLTTERRKWERENEKSMDIRSFLQNFSDLLSNKEVVDGNKPPVPRDTPRKFPFRRDMVNITKNNDSGPEKRGIRFSKPKYNINRMCALCGLGHYSDVCRDAMNMDPKEVIQKAKSAKLCLKCLKQNHTADVCRSEVNCEICLAKDHKALSCIRRKPLNPELKEPEGEQPEEFTSHLSI